MGARPAGRAPRGRSSPRPATLWLLPSRRAALIPREHRGGAGHGVRRRRRGRRKMAAGKSGGSAGGVFLKGTFGCPSGESRGEMSDAGISPGPRYSAVYCGWAWGRGGPGGPWRAGNALRARRLRVRPGKRLGQAGARRRGGSAASRGPGRPARGTPTARTSSHLHVFDGKFQTAKLGWNWPIQVGRGRGSCFTAFWLKAPRLAAAIGVQVRPGGAGCSSDNVFGFTL